MTDFYNEILKISKKLHYSKEKYEQLEKVMDVARRAKLQLRKLSELEIKNKFEFAISLTGAVALYESYNVHGDEGRIVYMNEKGQFVHHYADGRIIIKERV